MGRDVPKNALGAQIRADFANVRILNFLDLEFLLKRLKKRNGQSVAQLGSMPFAIVGI